MKHRVHLVTAQSERSQMRGFLLLPQHQAAEEQQNQGFSLFYLPFPTDVNAERGPHATDERTSWNCRE